MGIFLMVLIIFNLSLVPLAQAIWGTYLIGYKTFGDAMVSVFMIAYSKGNLEVLLDLNFIWSSVFMVIYYIIAIFFMHSAFHHTQTNSLKNIVLLNSLQETDVIQEEEQKKELNEEELRQLQMQSTANLINRSVNFLQWLLGWLPRSQVKQIGLTIKSLFPAT